MVRQDVSGGFRAALCAPNVVPCWPPQVMAQLRKEHALPLTYIALDWHEMDKQLGHHGIVEAFWNTVRIWLGRTWLGWAAQGHLDGPGLCWTGLGWGKAGPAGARPG